MRLLFVLVVFIIGVMGLQACHADNPPLTPPQEITLHFGRQGIRDFYAYTGSKSDNFGQILGFYSLTWNSPNLATIKLQHFGTTTKIPYVFHTMGTHLGYLTHGIGDLDIDAGLSQTEFTTAEQAYQDYVSLMNSLQQVGWKPYFDASHARIATESNLNWLMYDFSYGDSKASKPTLVGTNYVPNGLSVFNFKDWQTVINRHEYYRRFYIRLYLRDVIVTITIEKTSEKPNPIPNQPNLEQYMVHYHFQTAKYIFYSGNDGDRDKRSLEQQKQEYNEEYKHHKEIRQDYEAKAKNAGFSINESYQDPDMWQYIIEPAY